MNKIEYVWSDSGLPHATVKIAGEIVGWINASSQWREPYWTFHFPKEVSLAVRSRETLEEMKEFLSGYFEDYRN